MMELVGWAKAASCRAQHIIRERNCLKIIQIDPLPSPPKVVIFSRVPAIPTRGWPARWIEATRTNSAYVIAILEPRITRNTQKKMKKDSVYSVYSVVYAVADRFSVFSIQ